MENTIIKVDGMHCQGCVGLIRMELEDNGFAEKLREIRLLEGNQGEVELKDVSPEEVAKAKKLIDDLEGYKTI